MLKICRLSICASLLLALLALPAIAFGRSAWSPRHTGMEPPGGPKRLDNIPGPSIGRTPEGGMGHIDAYGNAVENKTPAEQKPHKRLRAGAYGGEEQKAASRPLPDAIPQKPLWKFQ